VAAAEEIARQLRLRDMGGIIVIDFIDMIKGEHRNDLLVKMQDFMAQDRAKHNILPLSKFGLMQITRQRVRPEIEVATSEVCPTCFGKGKIKSSLLFTDTLEGKIDYLANKLKVKKFSLHIHPYVSAYVEKGLFSLKHQWKKKYNVNLKIIPDQSLGFLEYVFYDKDGNEIDLKEEVEMK
jgi:ribonuclease G